MRRNQGFNEHATVFVLYDDPMTRETAIYLRQAASSGLFNSAASATCVALALPAVIGSIGLEAYGYWAILGAFVGAAGLLDLGMSKALVFLIPRDESLESDFVSAAVVLCLGAILAAASVVWLLTLAGVDLFGAAVARQPGLELWLAGAGTLVLACQALTTLLRAVLEARCKAHVVNLGFALFTLTYYGVAMLLAFVGADLRLIIAASAGVFVLTLAAHVQVLWADRPLHWRRPTRMILRRLTQMAARTFAVDLPSVAYLPLMLWSFLLVAPSGSAYGAFDLATRIAIMCATALSTIAVPFFALIAGARATEQQQHVRRLLDRFVPWMLLLAACGWLAFALVGARVLQWWMPEAPAELVFALKLLLAGLLLHAAFEPVTRMLLGLGYTRRLLVVRLCMLGTCAMLVLALHSLPALQRFSIAGAAGWATAAVLLAVSFRSIRWGRPDLPVVA
jgi:O-antigen/teichoic acid export membrane protein